MKRRHFLSSVGAGAAAGLLPAGLSSAAAAGSGPRSVALSRPRMADEVCRNYLINTKIFYAPTVYGHTDAVIDLLVELGVRGIRERVTTGTSLGTKAQLYAMPRLANQGVKWHATVGNLDDWPNAAAVNREAMDFLTSRYAPMVGGDLSRLMHSFGGCNEIDGPVSSGRVDPEWAAHARLMQRALWEQAGANSRTDDIAIAGPSTRTDFTSRKAAMLGDLSAYCDLGNGHLYNKGKSPTAEIDAHLALLQPCFPGISKYLITETGYNNSPQDDLGRTVPEAASAIYAVRGICDFYKRGAAYGRFELLDDPNRIDYTSQATINATAERESHFGLVAMTKDTVAESTPDTWRKKPEFYATKRLLALLEDRGPDFRLSSFNVSVSGGSADMQYLLLQKRNGKHYLVLWRDVDVSTLYPDASPVAVEPYRLTVQMAAARPIAVYAPSRRDGALRRSRASRSFTMSLGGELKVVEIG